MTLRVAITGATGQLGRELVSVFLARQADVLEMARPEWDITRADDLARLTDWAPDVVVNAAAWTDVDGCARDPERALAVNGTAAGAVARAAAAAGGRAVQISTNEVFDGMRDRPYGESDLPRPMNPYGRSKLLGEERTAAATANHLIVRTAWLFGPASVNFVTRILDAARGASATGDGLSVVDDEYGNPTPAGWLASAIADTLETRPDVRIAHLVGQPPASRFAWAAEILDAAKVSTRLRASRSAEYRRASTPPPRAVLTTELALPEGDWQSATRELVRPGGI